MEDDEWEEVDGMMAGYVRILCEILFGSVINVIIIIFSSRGAVTPSSRCPSTTSWTARKAEKQDSLKNIFEMFAVFACFEK